MEVQTMGLGFMITAKYMKTVKQIFYEKPIFDPFCIKTFENLVVIGQK